MWRPKQGVAQSQLCLNFMQSVACCRWPLRINTRLGFQLSLLQVALEGPLQSASSIMQLVNGPCDDPGISSLQSQVETAPDGHRHPGCQWAQLPPWTYPQRLGVGNGTWDPGGAV